MAFDINSITANDFKVFFYRDFSYLPVWIQGKTYKTGEIVFYTTDETFYTSLVDDNTTTPTEGTDWTVNVKLKPSDYVLDADIEKAFCEAQVNFNQGIFSYAEDALSLGTVSGGGGTDMSGATYFDGAGATLANSKLTTIDLTDNLTDIFEVGQTTPSVILPGDLQVTLNDVEYDLTGMNFSILTQQYIYNIAKLLQENLKAVKVLTDENTLIFSPTKIQPLQQAYLYLTAHYLVKDIQMATTGVSGSTEGMLTAKSVGNVSISQEIPDTYKNSPFLSYLYETPYGKKYLSLSISKTVGYMNVVEGATLP